MHSITTSTLLLLICQVCTAFSALDNGLGQVHLGQSSSVQHGPAPKDKQQPNILFLLTDDQDLRMNSLDYVPLINKHPIDRGTLFKRHFCTTGSLLPSSRVSLWTGKLAHNTNVSDINPPYGE